MSAVKTDTSQIIEAVKEKALDHDTFYTHVFEKTINDYYNSILDELASDFLALPIERQVAGLEVLSGDEAVDELAEAIQQIALIIAEWFLKDPKNVEVNITEALSRAPAADIREARLLRRHNLLN